MGKVKKTATSKHDASISPGFAAFISKLCSIPLSELPRHLSTLDSRWPYPRGDIYHWITPLNRFDEILADFNGKYGLNVGPQSKPFGCTLLLESGEGVDDKKLEQLRFGPEGDRELVQSILEFTRLLLEKCGNRTLYNSSDRLNDLLNTSSSLLLHNTLRVALCLAHRHREKSRGFFAPAPSPYYSLDLDKLQKLSGPALATHHSGSRNVPVSPVKTAKGKEKPSPTTHGRRFSSTVNPNDFRSLCGISPHISGSGKSSGNVKASQKEWSGFANVKILYSKTPSVDAPSQPKEGRLGSAATPLTPTPSRLGRTSTAADQGYFVPATELQEEPTDADFRTIEISSSELEKSSIDQLLAKYREDLPPAVQYELLHKLRNACGLLTSPDSRRLLLVIRLLAIANLACVMPEDKFAPKVFGQDQDPARRQRFIQQCTSLLQDSKKDGSQIPLYVQSAAMEVLGALLRQKVTSAEVCAALGISSSHGVLLLLTQRAVTDLKSGQDPSDCAEGDEWRELVFSMLRTALESTAYMLTAGSASVSSLLVVAYVSGLAVRSEKALRVQLKILELFKSFYHHVKDGLNPLSLNKAFDAMADLLEHLVKDALDKTSGGNGFPAQFRTPSTDFEIPYLHQIMIRSIVDLINDIGSHQGPHADRVLRGMIDSPALLGALRFIVDHASRFGAHTWSEVVKSICGFLHNEPTSYTMIAEAGLSRSILEAVTLQPIAVPNATPVNPSQPHEPSAQHLNEQANNWGEDHPYDAGPSTLSNPKVISDVPAYAPQGILASSDAILNIAQAFGAICLTNAGYDLFQSSGALQKFFEIFESPAHVKVMRDGPGLAMLGGTFDELVRHHPTLRKAVLSSVIVMLARVRYIGRLLSSKAARGPQLWRNRDGPEMTVDGDQSDTLYGLLPDVVSPGPQRTSTETELRLPDGNSLRLALRPDSSTSAAKKLVEECEASEFEVYDYVSPAATFLMNFFENQSLCNSFMESGATDLVLDLITLPLSQSVTVDNIHGISTNELPGLVHMMAETKPHIILPELLSRALFACRQLDHFTNNQPHGPESYFAALITPGGMSDGGSTEVHEMDSTGPVNAGNTIRALTALVSLILDLADAFDSPLYSNRSSGTPFTQVNLADLYAELCQALAKVAACCIREVDAIRRQTPAVWLRAMEKHPAPFTSANSVNTGADVSEGEAPDQSVNGAQPSPVSSLSHADGPRISHRSSPNDLVLDAEITPPYKNVETLRAILTEVPACVTRFLHMLSRGLDKKKMDTYQKQNASIVANALAAALVSQIQPYFFEDATRFGSRRVYLEWRFAYLLKVLANLKQPFFHIIPAQGVQCITWVVLAFKNVGGLKALTAVGEEFFSELKSCETSEDVLPLMTSANSGLKICLELLDSLTSAKAVIESPQSHNFKSLDPSKPFHFLPSQLLLELRMQSLPLVRTIWDSEYMSQASNTVVESLVSIMRHVLSGEHESDAYRNAQCVPEIRPYDSKKFAIDPTKLANLTATGVEKDLAQEALYRCNNSSTQAEEYCKAFASNSRRHRNPVPAYDIDSSSGAGDLTNGSHSASGADRPQSLRGLDALGAAAASALGELINGSAQDDTPGHAADDEEDDDFDMEDDHEESQDVENPPSSSPMSIQRMVNPDDAMATDVPIRQETSPRPTAVKNTIESPHLPKALDITTIFTVESIQAERESIRQDLAERCLNLLSSHPDIIFDLSELIISGAKKLPEDVASSYRSEVSTLSIQCLLSLQEDQITVTSGKIIAATAHLLALLLQDPDFYKKSLELLKESFDSLLEFVRTSPTQSPAGHDSFPWIGPVLLIVEKMLSHDAEPAMVIWQAPKDLEDPKPATYQDNSVFTPEQKAKLLDAVLAVLPTIGKDHSLALSVARVLVVLSRRRDLAHVIGERRNLQRLSVMVKQLSSNLDERLQSALMLILRHVIEDDETLRQIMRSEIVAHMSGRGARQIDTTAYVRELYPFVLRSPKIFVEVTNEKVKLHKYETNSRPQTLVLKPAEDSAAPEPASVAQRPFQTSSIEGHDHGDQPQESVEGAVESHDVPKSIEPKAPIVVNPDGVIHFLLTDLLNYKDVEDTEPSTDTNGVRKASSADVVTGTSNLESSQGHDGEQGTPAAPKKNEKGVFKAEDHPIHVYRCFILQCLTELLHSYNRTKIEFINFSRKADPMATTPSKPRSGVLNYLLNVLVTTGTVETEDSVANKKKALSSEWAMKVIVALCSKTGESGFSPAVQRYPSHPHVEDNDDEPDLAFVRRFVLEHAIKAFKDATVSTDPPQVKYARIVGLAELFNKLLSKPSGAEGTAGMHNSSYKVLSKMMFEKNLISILTASLAEIDLTFTGAKRVIKCILRPLHELTSTASRMSLTSSTPILSVLGSGEEEVISSASSSVSELDDDREETPDFYRNSTLGMSEPNHQHQSPSESEEDDDEEEDEEMFEEEEYGEEMEYGEPPVNDGEVVSDEELEEQMGGPGPIEGIPGDLPMGLEIVMTTDHHPRHLAVDSDDDDDDDDEDDDEDEDDEDEDDDTDDDEDDGDDGEDYIMDDEIDGDDENHSLADGPGDEEEWQNQEDEVQDEGILDAGEPHATILDLSVLAERPDGLEEQVRTSSDALLQIMQGGLRNDPGDNGGNHFNPDMLIPVPHLASDMLVPLPQHDRDDHGEDQDEDEDENEDEELDENEDMVYNRFNEIIDPDGDDDQWPEEEAPGWLHRPRHGRMTGHVHSFIGRHGRAVGDGHHVTGRPSRHMPPAGNAPDDGTNPLLQRHGADNAMGPGGDYNPAAGNPPQYLQPSIRDGLDHLLRMPTDLETLLTGLPFGHRDGGQAITGHGGMLDALMRLHGPIRHVHQGHGPPHVNIQVPMAELRTLLETPIRMPMPTLMRDDARANRVALFNPTVTAVRWQEEAKLLFGSMYVDKTHRVVNALLAKLVPPAIEEERTSRQKEIEERARLEEVERLERERLAKEAEEAEKKKREEEEAERKRIEDEERAAAEATAAAANTADATSSDGPEAPAEPMEDVQTTAESTDPIAASDLAPADTTAPRVYTTIRGQQLDITGMSIDAEYLEALPEEFREEVIMQQYASQREQAQEEGGDATAIDPDFLNALPEDIRDEIRQQEVHALRRREREAARRQATQAGGPAQPEEMDNDSFFATLDPALRRAILAEQPPEVLQQLDPRHAAEGRAHARHLFRYQGLPTPGQPRGDRGGRDPQRDSKKQVVQMIDKAGVATLLRLMFLPQQGSIRQNLQTVLRNVCGNRQTRFEVITLFLFILKEGSGDVSAVERSLASLSLRAKAPASAKTPQPLKRTLSMQPGGISDEITPLTIIQQCLDALKTLSRSDSHVKSIFLREADVSSSSKSKATKKGKGRENRASKFPLNDLISLLDRKLIMESSTCLQMCAELLAAVTSPLSLLLKKEKAKPPTDAHPGDSTTQPSVETANPTDVSTTGEDAVMAEVTSLPPNEEAARPAESTEVNNTSAAANVNANDQAHEPEDEKAKRIFDPPVVPDHHLQLVVSILVAQECSNVTFASTLESIGYLSYIPGASPIFREELISQAQGLSLTILADLEELLPLIKAASSGTDLQSIAMSKFSPAGSDQVKLLRVLTALGYLYDPKRFANQEHAEGDDTNAKSLLNSSYEKLHLAPVWKKLSECLVAIREKENMLSFATILISLIESLMVVCKNTSLKDSHLPRQVREQSAPSPGVDKMSELEELFFNFTTEHRKILNEIVRQNPKLMQGTGSFALLVKNPKVLEFDNKRSYFTKQIHSKQREQRHPQPPLQISVRRSEVFMDSYRSLYFKSAEEMKYGKLSIRFNNEEGVDAGGVTRDWYSALARGIFNPDYALWQPVAADKTTFHPSSLSYVNGEHLSFFKFIGRIIGKALHEGRVLDCHFSRAVYKQLLGRQTSLKDMESLDMDYYKSLLWILENPINDVITEDFSVVTDYFGQEQVVDLIPNGRNIPVTDENKQQYVQALVEHRLVGSVKEQLQAFVQGFHGIIPLDLVSIFNEQELELLISGLPEIDVDDWKANTEYHNYSASSQQIQWFWRAVKSFSQPEKASLLQFITGTSKVPLNGFRDLEGMHGVTKMNIHRDPSSKDRLPSSHTCFNQIDLPEYDSYETLRKALLTACEMGGNYFGFA